MSDSNIFVPPVNQRRRTVWRTVAIVAAVAVVVAIGWGTNTVIHACGGLSSGITKIGGECIGMTDGSFDFDSDLAQVDHLIKKENDRVSAGPDPYVKVVLLNPLTWDKTAPMGRGEVLDAVEGAYIAQVVENGSLKDDNDHTGGVVNPQIQLILANEGSHEGHWQPVVSDIEQGLGGIHPIIGVIGLGVSLPATQAAAKELASKHVPMVGGALSADRLDASKIPGLLNVSPSNADYVAALADYLKTRADVKSAMLVADSNDDLYTSTLGQDFRDQFGGAKGLLQGTSVQNFTGQTVGPNGRPALFAYTIQNICQEKPSVIFFAGRHPDLLTFISLLDTRSCTSTPMVIMTGATGLSATVLTPKDLQNKVSMIYSSSDAAQQWSTGGGAAPQGYVTFAANFAREFPATDPAHPSAALDDGYAIMFNDAMRTISKAVKISVDPTEVRTVVPTHTDVIHQIQNLSGVTGTVQGASGTLTFTDTNAGRAIGKPVPVLETTSAGSSILVDAGYTTKDSTTPS